MLVNKKTLAMLFAIFLFQFLLIAGLSHQRPFPDEGRYLTTGWMISQGKVPFVDTFSPKPPGVEFLFAGVFSVFGPSLLAARLFVAFASVAQIALVFIFARKVFGEKAALFSALFCALWSIGFSAYWAIIAPFTALILTAAVLFTYKFLFEEQSNRNAFAAGLFLGLSVLFKQTMLPFAAGIALAGLAINHYRNKKPLAPEALASALAGFAVVPVAFTAYLLFHGAFGFFVQSMLFPFSQLGNYLEIVIDERALPAVFGFLPVIVSLLALKKNWFNAREKKWEIALVTAWFAFSFANFFPFRACCTHLLPALPPASILAGFVIAAGIAAKNQGSMGKVFFAFSASMLLVSAASAAVIFHTLSLPIYSFSSIDGLASAIEENSSGQDTILVMPFSAEAYFLSQRMPAAKNFIFFDQCNEACQESVIKDLEANTPELIIYLTEEVTESSIPNEAESSMPLVDAYVKKHYSLAKSIELTPPVYKAYSKAFIFRLRRLE